jgi:hypothetical protein
MHATVFVVLLVLSGNAYAGTVPSDPRERVAHHLRVVDSLAQHFETVRERECPRFSSANDWQDYLDREVDRVVLLLAHLEQAWIEAKRTPDDDLRRTAKAPRQRVGQARGLVAKLQRCADDQGVAFEPFVLWNRIEQDVRRRQIEIALPAPE